VTTWQHNCRHARWLTTEVVPGLVEVEVAVPCPHRP
jgi:hypothetical protein